MENVTLLPQVIRVKMCQNLVAYILYPPKMQKPATGFAHQMKKLEAAHQTQSNKCKNSQHANGTASALQRDTFGKGNRAI